MTESTVILEPSSLDRHPPQEILIIEVIHGVVKIRVTIPIQTVDDMSVPGVRIDDVGVRVRVPSLVSARNGHLMDTIGVLSKVRHGSERMRRW